MYEHHDAVLHSVRNGVLILSDDGRLLLANDEAIRLLELPPAAGVLPRLRNRSPYGKAASRGVRLLESFCGESGCGGLGREQAEAFPQGMVRSPRFMTLQTSMARRRHR